MPKASAVAQTLTFLTSGSCNIWVKDRHCTLYIRRSQRLAGSCFDLANIKVTPQRRGHLTQYIAAVLPHLDTDFVFVENALTPASQSWASKYGFQRLQTEAWDIPCFRMPVADLRSRLGV